MTGNNPVFQRSRKDSTRALVPATLLSDRETIDGIHEDNSEKWFICSGRKRQRALACENPRLTTACGHGGEEAAIQRSVKSRKTKKAGNMRGCGGLHCWERARPSYTPAGIIHLCTSWERAHSRQKEEYKSQIWGSSEV